MVIAKVVVMMVVVVLVVVLVLASRISRPQGALNAEHLYKKDHSPPILVYDVNKGVVDSVAGFCSPKQNNPTEARTHTSQVKCCNREAKRKIKQKIYLTVLSQKNIGQM